jgi:hypothetical protein
MLTDAQVGKVGNFDQSTIDGLRDALGAGVEALSTTAATLSINNYVTELTVSATMTGTLPAPTVIGQKKVVRCVSAAASPAYTLTVTSPDTTAGFVCSGTFIFNAVGQEIEFQATAGLKWRAIRVKRAGNSAVNGVVVGTTVLTGLNLWAAYFLSVTGTVSSTTTKALPDGSAVGEMIALYCTTAAAIPSGTLGGNYQDNVATAKTGFIADATTDTGVFVWTGSAWQCLSTTATFS